MKSFYKGQKIVTVMDFYIYFPELREPILILVGTEGSVEEKIMVPIHEPSICIKLNRDGKSVRVTVYPEEIKDLSEYTLDSI